MQRTNPLSVFSCPQDNFDAELLIFPIVIGYLWPKSAVMSFIQTCSDIMYVRSDLSYYTLKEL